MHGLIIDSFAGGGGASTGIQMALGRSPDYAINHNEVALALHAANHPDTVHLSKNIWHVDPLDVVGKRHVGLAWFSPDCKHFSKAKGGKPRARNIRDLAWVVVLWAQRVRPDVICLENVEEFQTWGPLGLDNLPIKERSGETFSLWVRKLRQLGYRVQWRELRACDYGAPTIRKRLYLVARCDGQPIRWPEPTHGDPATKEVKSGKLKPWRTAAEIIDWSIPCPSIFLTKEEGKALGIKRPLAPNTMARIAKGVKRYVIDAKKPFIVSLTHQGGERVEGPDEPFRTITGAHRGEKALVVPHIMTMRNAQKPFNEADKPTHTITAGGAHMYAVAAFLAQHNNDQNGPNPGRTATSPVSTITATGSQQSAVAVFLSQAQQGGNNRPATEPHATITASRKDQNQIIAAHMINLKGSDRRLGACTAPVNTICSGGQHIAHVAAFLTKYYGAGIGADMTDPAHTVTSKDRFGLVTVEIDGETYVITDIGMRMLTPRELFRAQGFPESATIDRGLFRRDDGTMEWRKISKTAQTGACGNSVSPYVADAVVGAQFPEVQAESKAA